MVDVEDTERPFVAGMYDYYLGGTANSAADRAAVDEIRAVLPEIGEAAWASRGFLQRAVTRMARDWGIRQFLDIGAGLPTQRNTHEVVREAAPDGEKTAVVYVDIDPRVIARGKAMLADVPGTAVILGDLRAPEAILAEPELRALIDLSQPVGLLLIAVTHLVPDDEEAYATVRRYLDALAPGSYLAITAPTMEHQSDRIREVVLQVYAKTPTPAKDRTKAEVTRFFEGLEIVPPYEGGAAEVTFAGHWGAEDLEAADDDGSRWSYGAVGHKP